MISVTLVLSSGVTRVICLPPSKTIRAILDENGINYEIGSLSLNGKTIPLSMLDSHLYDHPIINGKCTLAHSIKRDNNE